MFGWVDKSHLFLVLDSLEAADWSRDLFLVHAAASAQLEIPKASPCSIAHG